MNSNYLDFGVPISFGWTAQYLDTKTQTRRQWKDGHAAKILRAYDRAAVAGQILRVPAIDKAYHAGGKQIGWCVIRDRPYQQRLGDMPESDLLAEGGMSPTVADFISKYFKGNVDLEVWVIDFEFLPSTIVSIDAGEKLDTEPVSNLSVEAKTGSGGIDPDFVDHQISQIASQGDRARWQLASYLKMFEVLSPDGILTDIQRQAVDNFAIGWQIPEHKCEGCDDDEDAPKTPVKSCCIPRQKPKPCNHFLEFDPEYDDTKYDRKFAIKRYLRLIKSPTYRIDLSIERFTESRHSPPEKEQRGRKPQPPLNKDLSLPPHLIVTGRKILSAVHKKIVGALAIHSHYLPVSQRIDIRTLFHETKSFGYRYNYKSESWECR